ncbi:MAG: peptidylprolyl isomerase [Alphaproteobacteria bacterium]|jgi:peptidylprolyl isomerase|tara:strand:- start:977 stop:1498 length:522 start_codon:yes stop_codon:yes gene_type:complete
MKFIKFISILLLLTTNIFAKEDIINIQLKDGIVKIKTFDDKAPKHVKRIKELVSEGFYDGIVFHRVIDGFMAQTGDPLGNGTGGSGQNIEQEFNDTPHIKGTLSMARSSDPNSADSQFFIVFDDAPHLDGQYTAWGQVIEGMDFVNKIKKGDPMKNGSVDEPDTIIKMWIDEK